MSIKKGIIHRDLKPGNVIVGMQEEATAPKIIDFGLAPTVIRETAINFTNINCGRKCTKALSADLNELRCARLLHEPQPALIYEIEVFLAKNS